MKIKVSRMGSHGYSSHLYYIFCGGIMWLSQDRTENCRMKQSGHPGVWYPECISHSRVHRKDMDDIRPWVWTRRGQHDDHKNFTLCTKELWRGIQVKFGRRTERPTVQTHKSVIQCVDPTCDQIWQYWVLWDGTLLRGWCDCNICTSYEDNRQNKASIPIEGQQGGFTINVPWIISTEHWDRRWYQVIGNVFLEICKGGGYECWGNAGKEQFHAAIQVWHPHGHVLPSSQRNDKIIERSGTTNIPGTDRHIEMGGKNWKDWRIAGSVATIVSPGNTQVRTSTGGLQGLWVP